MYNQEEGKELRVNTWIEGTIDKICGVRFYERGYHTYKYRDVWIRTENDYVSKVKIEFRDEDLIKQIGTLKEGQKIRVGINIKTLISKQKNPYHVISGRLLYLHDI